MNLINRLLNLDTEIAQKSIIIGYQTEFLNFLQSSGSRDYQRQILEYVQAYTFKYLKATSKTKQQ